MSIATKVLLEERNRINRLVPTTDTRNKYKDLNKQVKNSVKKEEEEG